LNSEIRNILGKYHIIGSIGTKKAGKSTFVELISTRNANSSIEDATKLATAYSIPDCDKVVIFDYPHSDSKCLAEKLEFYFTRLLLDHIYLIFEVDKKV
jgi:hypothetical protein